MKTVKVSPKHQIVIPQEVRDSMGILAGEAMQVMRYENRIEIIPVIKLKQKRGFLKGIETTVKREKERI